MKWKIPPRIKIYEALGCLTDGRIMVDGNHAKVYSSSGNKFYEVSYDCESNAIMSNDNGSYWQGYLGYPAIAFLLVTGTLKYNQAHAQALKGIAWKDLNVKFNNDFDKTVAYIHELLESKGLSISELSNGVDAVLKQIEELDLSLLGSRSKPPEGY